MEWMFHLACHEMFGPNTGRLREIGAGGHELQASPSNWWAKQNWNAKIYDSDVLGQYHQHRDILQDDVRRRVPELLREHQIDLGVINKVFASSWLSSHEIVLGTKCNRIFVRDQRKMNLMQIPSLEGSCSSRRRVADNCGIHAICKNPSGTLLASGAQSPCEVAVYKLPGFEPVTVGEGAHDDWIFDMTWLDDEFLVTGSRDSTIALFQFKEDPKEHIECSHIPWVKCAVPYPTSRPVTKSKKSRNIDKIRALACNHKYKVLSSVSLNSHLYMLDLESFQQVTTRRLEQGYAECVCMCHNPDDSVLVLGCRSQFTFFDARDYKTIHQQKLPEPQNDRYDNHIGYPLIQSSSVRSLSWNGPLITVGTGCGEIRFFDFRNRRYLECGCGKSGVLRISGGWLRRNESYEEIFMGDRCPNAVYTHCYDSSGIRLFAAGGPITAAVEGNYAGLWA